MEIRKITLYSDAEYEVPEDSKFFQPVMISGTLYVPILWGDSENIKTYLIKKIRESMSFREQYENVIALGYIDEYGTNTYVIALEK